jgi:hypothetical protein
MKVHSDWFNGTEILKGRWQHGEKVGYCYPSGLEKTLCKWDIYVLLVTKGLKQSYCTRTFKIKYIYVCLVNDYFHISNVTYLLTLSTFFSKNYSLGTFSLKPMSTAKKAEV